MYYNIILLALSLLLSAFIITAIAVVSEYIPTQHHDKEYQFYRTSVELMASDPNEN